MAKKKQKEPIEKPPIIIPEDTQPILEHLKLTESTLSELLDTFSSRYTTSELLQKLNILFSFGIISKVKRERSLFFFYKENEEKPANIEITTETEEDTPDSREISKIARKLRSSRYNITRNIKRFGINFSIKAEKKVGKEKLRFYILYVSDQDFFTETKRFDSILKVDTAIRIVASDETVKMGIAKAFNEYVIGKYKKKDAYSKFREEGTFFLLTLEEFFHKTTWKTLLSDKLKK